MIKGNFIHKEAAQGGWEKLSLFEQLGNIGSEVGRARKWNGKDEEKFKSAVYRALDLFDLTLSDLRWKGRWNEIARVREVFCDTVFGKGQYKTSLEDLEKYFMQFALAAAARLG